jgi:hypothetical protein
LDSLLPILLGQQPTRALMLPSLPQYAQQSAIHIPPEMLHRHSLQYNQQRDLVGLSLMLQQQQQPQQPQPQPHPQMLQQLSATSGALQGLMGQQQSNILQFLSSRNDTVQRSNLPVFDLPALQQQQAARQASDELAVEPSAAARSAVEVAPPPPPALPIHSTARSVPLTRPKRALTAYNLFFRDERVRLLGAAAAAGDNEDGSGVSGGSDVASSRVDGPKGKPGFELLAKTVGGRWRSADKETKVKYEAAAAVEKQKYDIDKAAFVQAQRVEMEESRIQLEATVDEDTRKRYFASYEKKRKSVSKASNKKRRTGSRPKSED